MRVTEGLNKSRATQANATIYNEFFDLLDAIHKEECQHYPEDTPFEEVIKAYNVYNLDETMAHFHKKKVLARKGQGTVYALQDNEWAHVTVLACINAAGEKLPPLIIHTGKNILENWTSGETIAGATYAATDNGWITREVYSEWFVSVYVPAVIACRGTRPDRSPAVVILLFDGHAAHISPEVVLAAEVHNIKLVQMPAHTSENLQPLDVSCFYGWHKYLGEEVQSLQRRDPHLNISRDYLAHLMGPAFNKALSPTNIISGFFNTGMYPPDEGAGKHRLIPPRCRHLSL
jgi:hypothetical protein